MVSAIPGADELETSSAPVRIVGFTVSGGIFGGQHHIGALLRNVLLAPHPSSCSQRILQQSPLSILIKYIPCLPLSERHALEA
jgi:hypothetical protein